MKLISSGQIKSSMKQLFSIGCLWLFTVLPIYAGEIDNAELKRLLTRSDFLALINKFEKLPRLRALVVAIDDEKIAYGIRHLFDEGTYSSSRPVWLNSSAISKCRQDKKRKNVRAKCKLLIVDDDFVSSAITFDLSSIDLNTGGISGDLNIPESTVSILNDLLEKQQIVDSQLGEDRWQSKQSHLKKLTQSKRFTRFIKKFYAEKTSKAIAIAMQDKKIVKGNSSDQLRIDRALKLAMESCEKKRKLKRIENECFYYMVDNSFVYPQFKIEDLGK